MPTHEQLTPDPDPPEDEFQELLAECVRRFERDGTGALDAFRVEHPAFASQLGKQLDSLAQDLASSQKGLPATIGPYRVLRHIQGGGMGEVYLAEQTMPFRRVVAVKVVKLGEGSEARVQRFATEIQALASLSHNGIAKVFEAGSDHGLPWFSMEYVPGRPITEYCAAERLDVTERLRLFVDVCRAVESAHRQGIIHRDLKPSNILVYGPHTEPVAKVIDFGLAKAIASGPHDLVIETASMAGTPGYMSPEQVDESGKQVVDTRADVYALGAVLYELLTGMLPLSVWLFAARDVQAMIRVIREREPLPPSARVGEAPAEGNTSPSGCGVVTPRQLTRLLAGDLDRIVLKALAKDVDSRYGGAAQFADDVLRFLRFEPVNARPHTPTYLLQRFARRHRAAMWFSGSILALGLASLVKIEAQARENQRNLEFGNLFGLVRYLSELRNRDSVDPPAARPEHLDALREWQREFEVLLAQRDRMRAFVEAAPSEDADRADPDLWASGRNAQRALRASLEETLRVLALMSAPGAELDEVRLRIDWAQQVVATTVDAHHQEWERVRCEVQDDERFNLDLKPQVGLVPIGRDSATGLQVFAMPLPGGEPPKRTDGRLCMGNRTWPVFVLLPGGKVLIGSQGDAADQLRHDTQRDPLEADPHWVELEPFFASMYEFTNGQWQLLNPGRRIREPDNELYAPSHPLCNVNAASMQHVVHAWGMQLPMSEQWEYLARGGTHTPYWCGPTFASLEKNENLFDRSRELAPGEVTEGTSVPWSDGYPRTAPVGSLASNPYLLFDVLGNVCEVAICDDPEGPYFELRGSSYHEGARDARATARLRWDGGPKPSIGFRPIIPVQR